MIIGHQKGRTVKDKVTRNFGMPAPEGYRKALRLMQMAERFNLPIITFIDTPGAYPGIGAEERGQSEAKMCIRDSYHTLWILWHNLFSNGIFHRNIRSLYNTAKCKEWKC